MLNADLSQENIADARLFSRGYRTGYYNRNQGLIKRKAMMTDESIPTEEIKYLGDVQRLALKPGDIIVLSASMPLALDALKNIEATLERLIPGHRVLVLDDGLRIGILSPEPKPEKAERKDDGSTA